MKSVIEPFGNNIIRLRPIEERDLKTTLTWRNRDEARIWFKDSSIIDLERHMKWYRCYQEKENDYHFIVEVSDRLVGQVSVYGIDWNSGHAEVGRFLVAPEEMGKGYISLACKELFLFCAEQLKLSYLFLEVMENNTHAIRLYRKMGFVTEGVSNGLVRMGLSLTK